MAGGPPIQLGVLAPLSGIVGMYGEEIARAAELARDEINETGGILGQRLELVVADDRSSPESAVQAAEGLCARGCVALIGNLLSNARIAVAYRVAEVRQIPLLNFSFYEGSILSPYFFHFAALPNQQIDRMIPYMRRRFGPRTYFAGHAYEWPRGSIAAAKRALAGAGGEVVGEEYLPLGLEESDLEALLDRIVTRRPDVVVPYFAGADQIAFLRGLHERGLRPRTAVVMGHFDEIMARALSPDAREGLFVSNTYFMSVDTPANQRLLARLASAPGALGLWPEGNGVVTNFGEGAHVCVHAFAEAARRAGDLEREPLLAALAEVGVDAAQGRVEMRAEHQHAAVSTHLARCRRDGTFEILESFGMLEPVLPERYGHERLRQHTTPQSALRLQARILSQLSEAVLLVRAGEGTVVFHNAAAERLLGASGADLGARAVVTDAAAPGAPHLGSPQMRTSLLRTGAWSGDVQATRSDGTRFWCSVSASAFTHSLHGEVWLLACRDATERRQLSDALVRERDAAARLLEVAPALVLVVDADGRITRANRYVSELTGQSSEALRGRRLLDALIPPHARDVARSFGRNARTVGEIRGLVVPIVTADGRERAIEWHAHGVPDDGDGGGPGVLAIGVDVTERRAAAEALAIKDAAIATSHTGIVIADPAGRITYANAAFAGMHALASAELARGEPLTSFLGSAATAEEFAAQLSAEGAWRGRVEIAPSEGEARAHDVAIHRVRDADGTTLATMGAFVDVGDQARAERERQDAEARTRASEARYRRAERGTNDGLWEWNVESGDTYISPRLGEILGHAPNDVASPIDRLLERIHPDDREAMWAGIDRHRSLGEPYDVELRLRREDGSYVWVRSRGQMTPSDGTRPTLMTGSISDISRQKFAEDRLLEAHRLAQLGTWSIDLTTGASWWSPEQFALAGLPPTTPVRPGLFLTFIHPDDRPRVEAELEALLVVGGTAELEYRVVRPDGEIRHLHGLATLTRGEGGRPVRLSGTNQDVTERIRAAEALQRSLAEKETLLREIHHRVKNNLQIVGGLVYFQAKKLAPPEASKLTELRDRIRAMALVHEKLYESSDVGSVDFGAYARGLVGELRRSLGSTTPVEVAAERTFLPVEMATTAGMIVCELVTNLLKYAFPDGRTGGASVTVARDDDRIRVLVADEGVGLPEGIDAERGGSFGWELVRSLVRQLDGELALERGGGLRVRIRFPAPS